ncbi:MAG: hypothetical protein ACOXZH_09920 [Bacteroidales bacterium]|jgi:hypothetical protein|nr:hypothetical protein [Bacteroidales bacterium]
MKKFIFFSLFLLLAVTLFFVYTYASTNFEKYKTYYFPQIETYMKVYKPLFNNYGYIVFSKDSVFSFSENSDFVRIYKSETSSVDFIFNPLENKKIYVIDRWNNTKINQSDFIIEKINRTDTTFFKQESIAGANTPILKPKYFEVFIEDYLQSVFYVDYNISESPIRAKSIK